MEYGVWRLDFGESKTIFILTNKSLCIEIYHSRLGLADSPDSIFLSKCTSGLQVCQYSRRFEKYSKRYERFFTSMKLFFMAFQSRATNYRFCSRQAMQWIFSMRLHNRLLPILNTYYRLCYCAMSAILYSLYSNSQNYSLVPNSVV